MRFISLVDTVNIRENCLRVRGLLMVLKLWKLRCRKLFFKNFLKFLGIENFCYYSKGCGNNFSLCYRINESNVRFSSSGREDCDVRCLGKGRPFYLEILDPKRTKYETEDFKALQNKINLSSLIQVRDLQLVHRSELGKIKLGEESKTKEYNALCISKTEITQEQMEKLNDIREITLMQKTPIRVLHRRPLAVRERKICKIKAKKVTGKKYFFLLAN